MAFATNASWEDKVTDIKAFEGKQVTALAIKDDSLYVAWMLDTSPRNSSISLYSLSTGSITDITDKIVVAKGAIITNISIDHIKNQVWITTNNNFHMSDCYSFDLHLIKRYSNVSGYSESDPHRQYLEKRMKDFDQYHNFRAYGIADSYDFDKDQAIIGTVKEGVYMLTFSNDMEKQIGHVGWASVLLTKERAFAGGIGLIVVHRATMRINKFDSRYAKAFISDNFKNRMASIITSLAANDQYLFIGTKGGLSFAAVRAFD